MTPALGLALAAAALCAIGVLRAMPYAPVWALAVGVLGYAVLAIADCRQAPEAGGSWRGRHGFRSAALPTIGLLSLGGGALSAVVLMAGAVAPAMPGWAAVGASLAVLLAAVLALD